MNVQPVSLRDGRKSLAFAGYLLLASVKRLVQKLTRRFQMGHLPAHIPRSAVMRAVCSGELPSSVQYASAFSVEQNEQNMR